MPGRQFVRGQRLEHVELVTIRVGHDHPAHVALADADLPGAERRQEDSGPYRSEFRYGSLTRAVRLPARVDAADVTARYDKGVLEISIPVDAVKPEGTRIPIANADAMPEQPPGLAG